MKVEKLEKGILKLVIEKNGEEFLNIKKNILATYKNRKVDGFRPGKASDDVLEKTFAKEIEQDILQKVVTEEYQNELKKAEFTPLSNLMLEKVEITKEGMHVELKVATKPEFEMPQYKGLNISEEVADVNDEEVENEIKLLAERMKEKIELTGDVVAELNHEANINFEGFVDDVAFEGGKAEDFPLVLGSKSFIDNFEDQIVGHKIGDEFDVNVTFPEEYHAENLKGKKALFKVKLNKLTKFELPEINDEFAKKSGSETLDELKSNIRKRLEERNKSNAKNKKINDIIISMKDKTNIEIADILVDEEINYELEMMDRQLQASGMNLKQYIEMMNTNIKDFADKLRPQTEEKVKVRFLLTQMAEIEKLNVTEEEINKEFEQFANNYQMTVDKLIEELNKENQLDSFKSQIVNKLMNDKIMNFLYDNN